MASLVIAPFPGAAQTPQSGAQGQRPTTVARSLPPLPLQVGAPAPPFEVGRWLTGEPIRELAKGRIYVLDFWGTKCAPCIKAFPELSDIADRYRDRVTVIGISLVMWSPGSVYAGSSDAEQDKLITLHRSKIRYSMAMDSPAGFMAGNWMNASHRGGIPYLMVVAADGTLAWTGDMDGLEPILRRLTGRSQK
jgi:thiol-disulfide isomerase/thioredoxin